MRTFVIKRLMAAIPLILIVTFITKALLVISPGDYLSILRDNPALSQEYYDRMVRLYHLDSRNILERYWYWFWPAIRGDFGYSYMYRQPVWGLIGSRILNTILLTGSAMIFSWALAVPLGILSAVNRNKFWDRFCGFISTIGISIPGVFLALLMVFLASRTGIFPTSGIHDQVNWDSMGVFERVLDVIWHLVLPVFVLGTLGMAQYLRQMRSEMIETLSEDFVRTARAKGLSWKSVVFKHALPNAINPLVTLFGFSLAYLLAGALLIEYVFGWPGIGVTTYEALVNKDEPLVMASLTLLVLMLVLGNLAADVILAWIDPRIRLNHKRENRPL